MQLSYVSSLTSIVNDNIDITSANIIPTSGYNKRYKSTAAAAAATPTLTTIFNKNMAEDGYLNKILKSKVYEVVIETEIQHAENLSPVSKQVNACLYIAYFLVQCCMNYGVWGVHKL